jgi:hypothetical protein
MKREITIKLDSGDRVIRKLPIKKYSELFLALQNVPELFENFDKLNQESILEQLPTLFAKATPDVIKIVAIMAEMPVEEAEELGFDEATDIFLASIEVNNYEKVFANIKKIMARWSQSNKAPKLPQSNSKAGSSEPSTP